MFGHLDGDVVDLEIQPLNGLPHVLSHRGGAVVLVDDDLAVELPQNLFDAWNIGVSADWLLNQDTGVSVAGSDRFQDVDVILCWNADVPEGWPQMRHVGAAC